MQPSFKTGFACRQTLAVLTSVEPFMLVEKALLF